MKESLEIVKTRIKSMDMASQRCAPDGNASRVSQCTAEHIERLVGCAMRWSRHHTPSLPACTTHEQFMRHEEESLRLRSMDEQDYFEATGCLAACDRPRFELVSMASSTEKVVGPNASSSFNIYLSYSTGRYEVREDYLLYDFGSFVADVGGYLGLLLGHSMYSIFSSVVGLLKDKKK